MANGLTLAYLGDAVFELMVRDHFVRCGITHTDVLHKKTTAIVNAAAQSRMASAFMDMLDEEEMRIYKRGRNSNTITSAKNQSIADYRRATGVEALFGYLYLGKKEERLRELFEAGMKALGVTQKAGNERTE